MAEDYKKLVRERILTGDSFVRAVFSGRQHGEALDWIKVVVRPVELKGVFHWQFSYFDERKDITKNYAGEIAAAKVDELLALPFKNIHVETTGGSLQVTMTKKGKALVSEKKSSAAPAPVDLTHDRQKQKILPANDPAPFLQAVGIMTRDGKIKADMQRKFRQINEFLRLVDETGALSDFTGRPVRVVDFGCGNAYLTFATYHYLAYTLSLAAEVVGVDVKSDLLERHREKAQTLGWERLTFQEGRIADFRPATTPDVVVALHACDTATDDALAQGIRWGSRLIVTAPCCQHELQAQLANIPPPPPFGPVAHYGLLNERLGDILTDTFRATILRLLGYRTDVLQFVTTEHTPKNLMIRAVKTSPPGNARLLEEYQALKAFWQVTPYLEWLLEDEYDRWLQG
jgi:SAM-dependent methyltransferase